jgi:hypothetical protein
MRLLLSMLILLPLCAQPPQGGRPAPKNLKILTADQVMPAMRSYTAGLGVKCDFCHVSGDFASDEKKPKLTARRMIAMTTQINTTHFAGKDRISCFTCHHGENEPKSAPAAAAPADR